MPALKLCVLSSEIVPFAKTGGLADVVGALTRNLRIAGHEVRAFMPLYSSVKRNFPNLDPVPTVQDVPLTIGAAQYAFSLRTTRYPGTDAIVYFIDCPALFDRAALYTFDADEHRRFLLFTRAALEACRRLPFAADIYHCNDWHTAFLPMYLKTVYASDPGFARAKSVLTIHNIGYQGVFGSADTPDLDLGLAWSQLDQTDMAQGLINPLKTGIKFADRVSTVSPTYAREISDGTLGMGLQAALKSRPDRVIGILNGVDYDEWDPRQDPYLATDYSPANMDGKVANKEALLQASVLRIQLSSPLIGMVTRLTDQKGIDLLFDALPALLQERDFSLVVLGSGEDRYVGFFHDLARRFSGRVSFRDGYDESFAHLIEAGSDMFLMPSRYEPCGLNQMYSLRYGTIPIVRNTGGLADSVQHFEPSTGLGTGCVFNDYDAPAVRWAVSTALNWFADQGSWRRLIQNAMAKDFSWRRQIVEYESLYRGMLAA